jgi:hypothetical protein
MFVRGVIIALLSALLIGGLLSYYQNDHKFETTVDIKTDPTTTNHYVEEASVKIFPNLPLKYDQKLSGKGRFIYGTSYFYPVYLKIEAPGYKTKRMIKILKPNEVHTIYIESEEKEKSG